MQIVQQHNEVLCTKTVQYETVVDVNGKNKGKSSMVPIVQSSSHDLSQDQTFFCS